LDGETLYDKYFGQHIDDWKGKVDGQFIIIDHGQDQSIVIPLFAPKDNVLHAVAILELEGGASEAKYELKHVVAQMSAPLEVAVEREVIYMRLEMDRQKYYETSIRDPLTGLFTRYYMNEVISRITKIHDRNDNAGVAVALFDLDHFKKINDEHGHNIGDIVLRTIARAILDCSREGDVPVRMGGEEFAVFMVGGGIDNATILAERLREEVASLLFADLDIQGNVTISGGIADRIVGESMEELLKRADRALYQAKADGRNRISQSK
jgi:diguanylate cyclase (GGDEF)-like protein